MKITLNGDVHNVRSGWTIAELIAHFDLPEKKLAVERNLEIVPKSAYRYAVLQEGDRLEIVHFIGGG